MIIMLSALLRCGWRLLFAHVRARSTHTRIALDGLWPLVWSMDDWCALIFIVESRIVVYFNVTKHMVSTEYMIVLFKARRSFELSPFGRCWLRTIRLTTTYYTYAY